MKRKRGRAIASVAAAPSVRSRPAVGRKANKSNGLPLTTSRPELLLGGRDREFRHLVHGLFGFAAHHERIRNGHAQMIGLAGIEYTVLIAIAHLSQDGDVNVKTVADHLYLSGAFITAVAGRLVQRGFILKRIDSGDRRRVTLTVSGKGVSWSPYYKVTTREVNDAEFGSLSREEFDLLTGIVDRLIESGARAVALQNYLIAGLGR